MPETNDHGATLGEYPLGLNSATGFRGDLVAAAKDDSRFPRRGSPEDVRKRLNEWGADKALHAAVDEVEIDWLHA